MKFNRKTGLINYSPLEIKRLMELRAMNIACGGIGMGSGYDCDNPLVAGVDQRLILINQADYNEAAITFDVTTTTLITNIVLASGGKQGSAFHGVRVSLQPQTAFVPQDIAVGYDHQVDFMVFDVSQEQKDNLEKLALGKVVAVIQNMNAVGNGNSVFEVFGAGVGLELLTNVRINADQATMGAYAIGLKTSDTTGKEPHLPNSYWDTNFVTTKAKVDTLLTPTA